MCKCFSKDCVDDRRGSNAVIGLVHCKKSVS